MNIFTIPYTLILILLLQKINIYNNNVSCYVKGFKLYETNLKVKNDLLHIHQNNTRIVYNFIFSYFKNIEKNTDTQSIIALKSQQNIIIASIKCNKLIKYLTKKQIENHKEFEKELIGYKNRYFLDYYTEEVFHYHHGLRFLNENIKKYIYNKDIVDVGSCIGDSLIVLQNYTSKIIHLYEFSLLNIIKLKKTIKNNKIKPDKYIIHKIGLSNFSGNIILSDYGSGGVGIGKGKGRLINVKINTLDNEFRNCRCVIGFIKADIEGEGYNFVLGAKNIIVKHRPVLSISIYHNYDEYFKTRYLLESYVDKYIYEYHQFNNCEPWACEFSLLAYPKESILL